MKKLFSLVVLVGGAAVAAKLIATKKAEWEGLTEVQVREKLEARMPQRVPQDKRAGRVQSVIATA